MVARAGLGPRRTVSALAIGLAASAVLTLFTTPLDPVAPQPDGSVTTTARAQPGTAAPAPERPLIAAGPSSFGPGSVTETEGAGLCTAGFVFTAGERTFLAQAAHCGGTGGETETDGCTSATVPLGTPVTVRGTDRTTTGRLAWSSWNTMQARGERDADTCAYNDLALVELPRADAAAVGAAVPYFGGPGPVRTAPLPAGTEVYGLADPPDADGGRTVGARSGIVTESVGGGWGHSVTSLSPGVAGESGSPLLAPDGGAAGILSSLTTGTDGPTIEYADLGRALDYARRTDGPAGLALAPGPAFDPAPPGVDPRDLATPAGPGVSG